MGHILVYIPSTLHDYSSRLQVILVVVAGCNVVTSKANEDPRVR